MSGSGYCKPVPGPDKSGWYLAVVKSREHRTCQVQEPNMSDKTY
jgi:hypothetical protein